MSVGEYFIIGFKVGCAIIGAVMVLGIAGMIALAMAAAVGWAVSDPEENNDEE